jgi:hypothetical protein
VDLTRGLDLSAEERRERRGRWSWATWDRWAGRGYWAGGEESRPAGRSGPLGPKGRRVWGLVFFFFSNLFKLLSSFQTLFKPKHFKLFSNFQIIVKTFKNSHQQITNTMQRKDDAQALIASKII